MSASHRIPNNMDALREFLTRDSALALAIGGLVLGFLFGAIVFRTNYCAMGSLSDIVNFGDWRRFRAWILAAATALIGAQLLQAAGVVALDKSMYMAPALGWVGHIVGGLMFGFGMVFAGGCPSRNLSRAGGGDLRALFTLVVLGLFAYMTIGGVFAPARAAIERASAWGLAAPTQGLGDLLAAATGLQTAVGNLLVTALLAGRPSSTASATRVSAPRPCTSSPASASGLVVIARLGADRPCLRRVRHAPDGTDLADLRASRWRRAGMAAALHRRAGAGLRHGQRVWRAARRVRCGAGHGPIPRVHLLRHRRHPAQSARRRPDGHRRRAGARLHGRPGDHGRFDPGSGLVPDLRRYRRRRRLRPARAGAHDDGRISPLANLTRRSRKYDRPATARKCSAATPWPALIP